MKQRTSLEQKGLRVNSGSLAVLGCTFWLVNNPNLSKPLTCHTTPNSSEPSCTSLLLTDMTWHDIVLHIRQQVFRLSARHPTERHPASRLKTSASWKLRPIAHGPNSGSLTLLGLEPLTFWSVSQHPNQKHKTSELIQSIGNEQASVQHFQQVIFYSEELFDKFVLHYISLFLFIFFQMLQCISITTCFLLLVLLRLHWLTDFFHPWF